MPFIHDKEPAAAVWRRILEKPALLDPALRQEIRRVLAQSPMPDLASLAMGGLPAAGGLVQGAVKEDPFTLWKRMVKFDVERRTPAGPGKQESPEMARAKQAIRQMLSLPDGIELIQQLGLLFGDRDQPTFEVHFVNELKKDFEGAGGYFVPEKKDQSKYQIYIKNDTPMDGVFSREWPQGPGEKISSLSVDPASNMARTLHHELLHVWYLHTQSDKQYPTGHKDVGEREIAQLFWNRLRAFAEQQDDFTRPARERR
jgi:hypothetical protein